MTCIRQSMSPTSFTLVMLAIAGTMALLLGIAGVYGVIAYAVTQRRREIGIRIALGAQAGDIRRLFVRRGLTAGNHRAGCGTRRGARVHAAGWNRWCSASARAIRSRSPRCRLSSSRPPLLASYLPARRAAAIDPVETMRAD